MDAAAHCEALLHHRDEDRWLAARYAPFSLRCRLIALYTLHSELKLVPSRVSEPPLGEIRIQWHRDALEEIRAGKDPRAHPIVEALADAGLADSVYAPWLEQLMEAASRPLYGEAFSGGDDLISWLEASDGAVDAAAVLLCGGDAALAKQAQRAGAAFAAAREGPGIAPDLDMSARANEVWQETKNAVSAAPATCAPALAHLYLTPIYAKRGARPLPILKRIRLFSAIAFGR